MIRLETDKKGIILLLLVFVIVDFTTFSAAVDTASYINLQRKKICRTPLCQRLGPSMVQKMDQTVHPCNNFYEFACGNFIKNTDIPEEASSLDVFSDLTVKNEEKIKNSIESELKDSDPKSFKLLQTLYKTCMNEDQIDKTSENEFLEILKKMGGWPILMGDSWNESDFHWNQTMFKFRDAGFLYNYFFDSGVKSHPTNSTRKILFVGKAILGCSQKSLTQGIDQKIVKAYSNFLVNVSTIFGANRKEAEQEVAKSLNFEIELAKILPLEKSEVIITIKEMQEKYPFISWIDHFNRIVGPHEQVTNDDEVYLSFEPFINPLFKVLEKTPKRVLANYAFSRLAIDNIVYLSNRLRQAKQEYIKLIYGNTSYPRWQSCLPALKYLLRPIVGSLYVRRYFNENSKVNANEIIHYIRESFQKIMSKAEWMDENTKITALDKLNSIETIVGYPDELLDNKILDKYYENLKLYPESYLKSVLSIRFFKREKDFENFRQPKGKFSWTGIFSDTVTVNAYYDTDNAIAVTAGILQEPFFNADYPKYMNYAGIGMLVGHELTHGFDTTGSAYDKKGDKFDWWDPKTKQEFLNRAQCIVDQYSNYTNKEVDAKIDGKRTQGENIADNGGIKEAYLAYSAYERKTGPGPRLPGLEMYSPKQTFWISYAQVWCTKYRPEYLKTVYNADVHAPEEYRIIGTVSNSRDFANDFKCPINSPMNPVKKCSVW